MAEINQLHDPWLVAAWPGMGNVAVGAAGYMLVKLGARLAYELPSHDAFDIQHIDVKHGLAKAARFPRNMFFEWKDPQGHRDLLIFLGEAQPANSGYAFCHKLLDYALPRGVKRLFTFAAMASPMHPTAQPRVFGAATNRPGLQQLKAIEASLLEEGQISGLNGVLLAAGAERAVPGICLLGEMPFFAASVPNPKASQAVLEVFTTMAGIELDFAELKEQADVVDKALVQLLEKMQEAARQAAEGGEEGFTTPEFATHDEPTSEGETEKAEGAALSAEPPKPTIDYRTRRRIEAMFHAAQQDRAKAFALKQELDRLGVFEQYENRFLDLFKKAE